MVPWSYGRQERASRRTFPAIAWGGSFARHSRSTARSWPPAVPNRGLALECVDREQTDDIEGTLGSGHVSGLFSQRQDLGQWRRRSQHSTRTSLREKLKPICRVTTGHSVLSVLPLTDSHCLCVVGGLVTLWDPISRGGRKLIGPNSDDQAVMSLSFSPDGSMLALGEASRVFDSGILPPVGSSRRHRAKLIASGK